MVDQQQRRRRLVIIELGDERAEHLRRLLAASMQRKERPVAVVAAASDEEHLHTRLTGDLPRRDDVGILQARRVDDIVALHERQPADAVADGRRAFELQRFRGVLHLGGELLLHGR
jgi:hypothetical protein